jgi:hypothetical protein
LRSADLGEYVYKRLVFFLGKIELNRVALSAVIDVACPEHIADGGAFFKLQYAVVDKLDEKSADYPNAIFWILSSDWCW